MIRTFFQKYLPLVISVILIVAIIFISVAIFSTKEVKAWYSPAAPTFVQKIDAPINSTSPFTLTFGSNTTAGNAIVVWVEWQSASTVLSVTDTQGNTYTLIPGTLYRDSTNGYSIEMAYTTNIVGGADTLTVTLSSTSFNSNATAIEYSGIATSNPVDQSTNTTLSSSASPSIGPLTPTNSNDLAVTAFWNLDGTGGTWTAGSGYVKRSQTTYYYAVEDQTLSNTSAVSGTVTFNTPIPTDADMVLFKPPSSTWAYRQAIVIDHTKVPNTDQAYFPVLIDITDPSLVGKAQSSGNDILFTSSDGATKLNYEREVYTSATGRLTAWVQVPVLSHTVDTTIYMYYGNASASDQQSASATWNDGGNNYYVGVWHLGSPVTLTANDSTSDANTGTVSSATATNGQIYGAANFSGTSYIDASTISNWPTTTATECMWVDPSSVTSGQYLTDAAVGGTSNSFAVILGYQSGFFNVYSATGGGYIGSEGNPVDTEITATPSTWQYVCYSSDGTNVYGYLNGSQVNSTPGNLNTGGTVTDVLIGANNHFGAGQFGGSLDEIEDSDVARSGDWIKTEYNNQSATSTFFTLNTTPQAQTIAQHVTVRGGGQSGLGPVSFDNTNHTIVNGTSLSFPITIGSGANRAIAVGCSWSTNSISGINVTVGGVTANPVSGTDSGSAESGARSAIYALTNPSSGSQTVAVSWTTTADAVCGAVSVTGVDQTTPMNNGTFAHNPVGTPSSVTINSNAGDLTFDTQADSSGVIPTSPTQTSEWADHKQVIGIGGGASIGPGIAGPITHTWNYSTGSNWTDSGANFKEAQGGGKPLVKVRGGGTPAILQACNDQTYQVTNASCSLPNPMGSGNTIVAISYADGVGETFTMSGCGGSWTSLYTYNTANYSWTVWTTPSVSGNSCTPSVSLSTNNQQNYISVMEVSGIGASDVTPAPNHNTSCSSCSSASITTATNGDLVLLYAVDSAHQLTFSNFSNNFGIYTQGQTNVHGQGSASYVDAYLTKPTIGSISSTWNITGGASGQEDNIIMAFKPVSVITPYVKFR